MAGRLNRIDSQNKPYRLAIFADRVSLSILLQLLQVLVQIFLYAELPVGGNVVERMKQVPIALGRRRHLRLTRLRHRV